MQPDRILSYASDGLTAALYRGRYAPPSDRIVIMLGGSDGSYALTQTYAAVFAENGLTALAVPYRGQPHLAQGLAQIAVETVETAVRRAQEMGFCQTGVWGISMGAQLALLAASLIPDISRVAAVSPLDVCVQGLQTAPRRKLLDCSAFTWRGYDLPYCPLHMNRLRVLRDCVKTRSLCLRSCYRAVDGAAGKHASGWKTSKARCCCFPPKTTPCGLHTKPRGASSAVWKTAASGIPSSNAPTTARGITCFRWKAAGTNCLPTPAVTRRTTWPPPATRWRRRLTFSTAGNRAKAV